MPEPKPRDKKPKQPSSIWDIVDDYKALEKKVSSTIFTPLRELGLDGWTHWPSPYNFQAHIDELACQRTWQAKVRLYVTGTAWFFYSDFVPSPVEITRKFLLGGYKCGFYSPLKFKSPLTAFIGTDGVEILAEVVRPATKVLFWWWVASSVFTALDTWHTVQLKVDECTHQGWECLLGFCGAAVIGTGSITPVGAQAIYDPLHRQIGTGAAVLAFNGSVRASAFCYINWNHATATAMSVSIQRAGVTIATVPLDMTQDPLPTQLSIDTSAPSVGSQAFRVRFTYAGVTNPFGFVTVNVNRFTVTGIPT